MPRMTINRSISFDPEIFEKMESRRAKLLMQRSEYITRLVIKDMLGEKAMHLSEVPTGFLHGQNARDRVREAPPRRRKK